MDFTCSFVSEVKSLEKRRGGGGGGGEGGGGGRFGGPLGNLRFQASRKEE